METFLDRPGSDAAPAVPLPLGAAASSLLDAAVSSPLEAAVSSPMDAVSQPLGAAVSGPLAAAVLGTTAVVAGLLWDISWHASIGRDTFWTPAHLAIYVGGLLCGLSAGWLALSTTFAGTAAERGMAVGFWGFRAPLGAWVAIWGSIAMLTSAALRQLVARRLRSRRQDHLAAAPAARRRRPGDAARRHAASAGGAEPPGRSAR